MSTLRTAHPPRLWQRGKLLVLSYLRRRRTLAALVQARTPQARGNGANLARLAREAFPKPHQPLQAGNALVVGDGVLGEEGRGVGVLLALPAGLDLLARGGRDEAQR